MQSQQKSQSAISSMIADFPSFLRNVMKSAEYPESKVQELGSEFKTLMRLSLIQVAMKLRELKENFNKGFSDTERNFLFRLNEGSNQVNEPILMRALEIFNFHLHSYVKKVMISSHFPAEECEESHKKFLDFLSLFFEKFCEIYFIHFPSNDKNSYSNRLDEQLPTDNTIHHNENLIPESTIVTSSSNSYDNESTSTILLLADTSKYLIYRVTKNGEHGVLKVLKDKNSNEKLNNEYQIGSTIIHPVIRKSLMPTKYQDRQALVLEWAYGIPLSEVNEIELEDFFSIAREIVSALLELHSHDIIHTNLSCSHILYDEISKSVTLIGLGAAKNFSNKLEVSKEEVLEKELLFVSPEQTGRIKQDTDFRSDFYSLGVIFYKLLTGVYPLVSENSFELLHMHIFQEPIPVCQINKTIPSAVSRMCCKLLKKSKSERYQSARGLIHDIDLMIAEYATDKQLNDIVLAQHDKTEIFYLPQRLYGRSAEYNLLFSTFEKVSRDTKKLAFISGNAGTGKSHLVKELCAAVAQGGGTPMIGKFDCQRRKPYYAIVEALEGFCNDLILQDKITLANFKFRIINAIAEEGRVLTDVIKNLEFIIGEQPQVSECFGVEATRRFDYVFINFMKAICSVGSPTLLVLEDLQRLDLKSYDLLFTLIKNKSITNLMILGTYRENEIDAGDPVEKLLDFIEQEADVTKVKLGNFDHEIVNEIISDAVQSTPLESYSLSTYIYSKTRGNLLYLQQMLISLADGGSIFYCKESNSWKWRVGESGKSEDVLEFLCKKIKNLDDSTQQVLITASCLGNPFSLEALKIVVNNNNSIESALSTGMLTKSSVATDSFRFSHDKVEQAAFSLLPVENRSAIFWYIAKKLWKQSSHYDLESNIYVVVNLFQKAMDFVTKQDDSHDIAELFLRAGKKAMTSTAFNDAIGYFDAGIKILHSTSWKSHYRLCLKIHDEAAKAYYCIADYGNMNLSLEAVSLHALSALDLVNCSSLKIKFYNDRRMFQESLLAASDILDKLDPTIQLLNYEKNCDFELSKAKNIVMQESQAMLELKDMQDEKYLSISKVIADILRVSFYFNPKLKAFCASKMLQLTYEYGISKFACLGFMGIAPILLSKDIQFGHQVGTMAINFHRKNKQKELTANMYLTYYGEITPAVSSIHGSIEPFMTAYKCSLEVGSHIFSSVSANCYCRHAFLTGKPLESILEDIEVLQDILFIKTCPLLSIHQAILNLSNPDQTDPAILKGSEFNAETCCPPKEKPFDIARAMVMCCIVAYIFNDYFSAYKYVKKSINAKTLLCMLYPYTTCLFYESLIILACIKVEKLEEDGMMKVVQENLVKLKDFEKTAPMNFQNKVCLIEAEIAVLQNQISKAEILYKKAIAFSRTDGFPHEEALSHERLALFYIDFHATEKAAESFKSCYQAYEMWGAKRKLRQLFESYPAFFFNMTTPQHRKSFEGLQLVATGDDNVSLLSTPSGTSTFCSSNVSHDKKRVRFGS